MKKVMLSREKNGKPTFFESTKAGKFNLSKFCSKCLDIIKNITNKDKKQKIRDSFSNRGKTQENLKIKLCNIKYSDTANQRESQTMTRRLTPN